MTLPTYEGCVSADPEHDNEGKEPCRETVIDSEMSYNKETLLILLLLIKCET